MKQRVQYIYAGHNGQTVYVCGFLTDEHEGDGAKLLMEVTGSEPETRIKPGLYRPDDLPGGWMMILRDRGKGPSEEEEAAIAQAAGRAGFELRL